MAESWIFQAIAVGVDQVKDIGANMWFGAEHGVWGEGMAIGVDRVWIKPGSLAARLRPIGQVLRSEIERGAQAFLQLKEGHARLQVVEMHLALGFSWRLVLFTRPLHGARNVLLFPWFWQLWEEEDAYLGT